MAVSYFFDFFILSLDFQSVINTQDIAIEMFHLILFIFLLTFYAYKYRWVRYHVMIFL